MGADYRKAHKSVMGGMTTTAIAGGAIRYEHPSGGPQNAVELDVRITMPFDCHITRFNIRSQVPPGAGETYDLAVMLDGIATALDLQIAGAADVQAGPDLDVVGVAAQQELTIRVTTSALAANSHFMWSFEVRH